MKANPNEKTNSGINPEKTRVTISSISRAVIWSGGLIVCGFTVGTAIEDFKKAQNDAFIRVDSKFFAIQMQLDKMQKEVEIVSKNSWTLSDMERYTNKVRWDNRTLNLSIPDPKEIMTR
jgi:hypothetical protein